MRKRALDAQMAKDQEVVAKLDEKLKELYLQELRSTVDRSVETRVAPQNRVILSY
jgi:uncharacterized coiled-coil protein SlyX